MKTNQYARPAATLAVLLACVWVHASRAFAQPTALSVAGVDAAGGDADSAAPIMSADGRYVLFASQAGNLASGNGSNMLTAIHPLTFNVYLRDRLQQITTLVSVSLSGGAADGDSFPRAISASGQYVLFESSADNLTPGDTNGAQDVFVRDTVNQTTTLTSVSMNGGAANGLSQDSTMTPDGRYVAFSSQATNLVAGDTNQIADVFVRDMQAGRTTLASVGAIPYLLGGQLVTGVGLSASELPQITPDGRYVAFLSTATNLVQGALPPNGNYYVPNYEIYVRDLVGGVTYWASANAQASVQAVTGITNTLACSHVISTNGLYVAFIAGPLPMAKTNAPGIVSRYNLQTGFTDIIHTNVSGITLGFEEARTVDMTADGRFVAFVANATGNADTNTAVYLWDAETGNNTLVTGDTNGNVPPGTLCAWPIVDPTGRYILFESNAIGLTTNSVTSGFHLYQRDMLGGLTALMDVDTNNAGAALDLMSAPDMSDNGRWAAYESRDTSLVANDSNHRYDIFVHDNVSGVTEIESPGNPSLPASSDGPSQLASSCASSDGRYVVFASDADNLVPTDTNGYRDVFVRDLLLGTTTLVSVGTNGVPAAGGFSYQPAISGNGQFVVFVSFATNLVSGAAGVNTNGAVFYRDLLAGTNALIGTLNSGARLPSIGSDGQYVYYLGVARSMSNGVTHGISGATVYSTSADGRFVIYGDYPLLSVWDSQSAATTYFTNVSATVSRAAISLDGTKLAYLATSPTAAPGLHAIDLAAGTNKIYVASNSVVTTPSNPGLRFSADGRYLAFANTAKLVAQDTNGLSDVYVYDFMLQSNILVSRSCVTGAAGNGASDSPDISPDGRFVVFRSFASNLVPGDTNGQADLFLHDMQSGATTLLTVSSAGNYAANDVSIQACFSPDSQSVAIQSAASDLAAGDFNGGGDIFLASVPHSDPAIVQPPFFGDFLPPAGGISGHGTSGGSQNPGLMWTVTAGKTYQVQYKTKLTDPTWLNLNGVVTIVGGQGSATDFAPDPNQRFYRIIAN